MWWIVWSRLVWCHFFHCQSWSKLLLPERLVLHRSFFSRACIAMFKRVRASQNNTTVRGSRPTKLETSSGEWFMTGSDAHSEPQYGRVGHGPGLCSVSTGPQDLSSGDVPGDWRWRARCSWAGKMTACSEKLDRCVNALHSHLGNHWSCSVK